MFESTEELALHKLMILYLLDQLDYPIANTQLTHVVLEKNYIDYFSLQQYLGQLLHSHLIDEVVEKDKTCYTTSQLGKQTLEFFSNRIPSEIRKELDQYVTNNKQMLKKAMEITADYIPENEHEFIVHCKIQEQKTVLLDVKIAVASKDQAQKMVSTFKNSPEQVYHQIVQTLLPPSDLQK